LTDLPAREPTVKLLHLFAVAPAHGIDADVVHG